MSGTGDPATPPAKAPSVVPSVATIVVALGVAVALAFAGSSGGATTGGVGVFALCVAVAFGINWVVWVPSTLARTEKYYDLTGTLTYLAVVVVAVVLTPGWATRSVVLAVVVAVWTLRLGTFLFARVRADGGDGRFDTIKVRPVAFLSTWTLQGLWVSVTAAAALAAITAPGDGSLGVWGVVGLVVWAAGFALEVVADAQKRAFRRDPANAGRFITSGVWAWSRHPNYAGEIILWLGVALVAVPALEGWRWATLISPVFVWLLLTRVSGIPLLERRAKARWGDDPDWQAYQARTPALWPRPPRGGAAG